jgi:hypothetical protein
MSSRMRDQFIVSVHALKNRPKMLRECIDTALRWKKTGDLTAEEFDLIVAASKMPAVLRDVK